MCVGVGGGGGGAGHLPPPPPPESSPGMNKEGEMSAHAHS